MEFTDLKRAGADRLASVLHLNALNESETSPLGIDRLRAMVTAAFMARAAVDADGQLMGFLIAFTPDAAYDSPNFLWFRARSEDFVYVDRIVIAAAARGRGLARQFYAALFGAAAAAGFEAVACEVNLAPPNPGSDAFHAVLGFAEVGGAMLAGGKRVRYLRRPLP